MNERYILFSPIGLTDPIKNNHDGPMLQIVRRYKPEIVFLFLTKETVGYDHKDNRYELCIQNVAEHLGVAIEVRKIETDIVDPQKFDMFIYQFNSAIAELKENYPEHTILLNVTSGTPQMQMTLATEAVLSKGRCKSVQIETPARAANHPNDDFDVAKEIANNYDNLLESPSRCVEPKLFILRKNNFSTELRALLEAYNYNAAWEFCKREKDIFRDDLIKPIVFELVEHLHYRAQFDITKATKVIAEYQGKKLFPVANVKVQNIVEYFMLMSIRQKRTELGDFFMRLSPFVSELAEYYLTEKLRVPLSKIAEEKSSGEWKLSRRRMDRNYSGLLECLNIEFGNEVKENIIGLSNLLPIIGFFEKNNNITSPVYNLLRELREYESRIRNKAAHSIVKVDESLVKSTANEIKQIDHCYKTGKVSADILQDSKKVMKIVLKDEKNIDRFMYDEINQFILDEL